MLERPPDRKAQKFFWFFFSKKNCLLSADDAARCASAMRNTSDVLDIYSESCTPCEGVEIFPAAFGLSGRVEKFSRNRGSVMMRRTTEPAFCDGFRNTVQKIIILRMV